MSVYKEVEKIIADLPPEEAFMLRYWLLEFQSASRYKKLKGYVIAVQAWDDFKKTNSNALWN